MMKMKRVILVVLISLFTSLFQLLPTANAAAPGTPSETTINCNVNENIYRFTMSGTGVTGIKLAFVPYELSTVPEANDYLVYNGIWSVSGTTYALTLKFSDYAAAGISAGTIVRPWFKGVSGAEEGAASASFANCSPPANSGGGAVPTISSVSSSTANGSYRAGTTIDIAVTFSGPVTVVGVPRIKLETGSIDQEVDYSSKSGSSTLIFNYVIQDGDATSDLDYFSTSALALNGGTIKDAAGNDAVLTLASRGASGSLGNAKALIIDNTAPTATLTTTGTILTSENASVQSTEAGTAYLVNSELVASVANVTSITNADGALWNSVAVSAGSSTNLSAAGLNLGNYVLYTADAAGNLSVANGSITVSMGTPTAPDLDAASDLGESSSDDQTADNTPTFTVGNLAAGATVTVTATSSSGTSITCTFIATGTTGSCASPPELANATYSIKATQSLGGVTSADSTALPNVKIEKTTLTPSITLDLSSSDDTGSSDSDNITNDSI
jgi:hypothetical protein